MKDHKLAATKVHGDPGFKIHISDILDAYQLTIPSTYF